jgi:hypothetical protein
VFPSSYFWRPGFAACSNASSMPVNQAGLAQGV